MAKNFLKTLTHELASELTTSRAESEKAHEEIVEKLFEDSMKSVLDFVKAKYPHTPIGAQKLVIKFTHFMLSQDGSLFATVETSFEGCIGTYFCDNIMLLKLPSAILGKEKQNTSEPLKLNEFCPASRIFDDAYLFVREHPEYQKITFPEIFGDTPTYNIPVGVEDKSDSNE